MAGRPKVLTDEQVKANLKASQKNYKIVHKEKYNAIIRKYNANNREKIRKQQNDRYEKRNAHKKCPFYNGEDNPPLTEEQKQVLRRMAELMKVGCEGKKSFGENYGQVCGKIAVRKIMQDIGFTEVEDWWISRAWAKMPLKSAPN